MHESIKIVGGEVYYMGEFLEATIVIENGKIAYIGKESKSPNAETKIDATNKLVIPGAIDVHVHFRDPGFTWKEDFYTGSSAAAAGGVTTVLDMPNTNPPTNTINAIIDKIEIGEKKSIIDFSLHSGLPRVPHRLCDLPVIGVPSVKIYSYKHYPEEVKDYLAYASKRQLKLVFTVHAENRGIIEETKKKLEGAQRDLLYHGEIRSPRAELVEVKNFLSMAEEYAQPIHFAHISTKQAFKEIVNAKERGLKVTFEVTPHHILLEQNNLRDPYYKVNPPLRSREHREYLMSNLDKVDVFASDHAPHTLEEKRFTGEDIEKIAPGFPGVETLVPLILDLASKKVLSYEEAVSKLTEKPATIFGLNGKGFLAEGYDADIAIIDHKKKWTIRGDKLHSKVNHTPFEGRIVKGFVETTIVRGAIVYKDGEIIGKKGWGKFIRAWRASW